MDNEDEYELLVEYKECLLKRFKEGTEAAEAVRQSMKDDLLEQLRTRFVENLPDEPADVGSNEEEDTSSHEVNQPIPDEILATIRDTGFDK